MKKILVLLFSLITINSFAVEKGKEIDIYYKNQYIESISLKEFETQVKMAENYYKEILAEKNKKIKIVLEKSPWEIINDDTFETKAEIQWYDENNKIIKTVIISINIRKDNQTNELLIVIDKIYTQTAKYGFPVVLLILVVVIAL